MAAVECAVCGALMFLPKNVIAGTANFRNFCKSNKTTCPVCTVVQKKKKMKKEK